MGPASSGQLGTLGGDPRGTLRIGDAGAERLDVGDSVEFREAGGRRLGIMVRSAILWYLFQEPVKSHFR